MTKQAGRKGRQRGKREMYGTKEDRKEERDDRRHGNTKAINGRQRGRD